MKITLLPDDHALDEVMVVAFGTAKKSAFTGSAAVVDSKVLSQKVTTNVADALAGSVPGLQLRGATGQPGSDSNGFKIRGIASMYASTNPLVIVDGAPYPDNLSSIPTDDIESVTVLKDAASAALYGARGAAGVIIITTRAARTAMPRLRLMPSGVPTPAPYKTMTLLPTQASIMRLTMHSLPTMVLPMVKRVPT